MESATELSALEIACGVPLGRGLTAARPDGRPHPAPGLTPLAALEAAVEPALRQSPCLVSFSGGVDSSLVLAVGVSVARRRGLPDPIPITWRFSDAPAAEESRWQELMVRALGVGDWERRQAHEDLDLLGPVSVDVLQDQGLRYPANAYLHQPLMAAAAGGALLTGIGGDQTLGHWQRRPLADLLTGRVRPSPRSVRGAVRAGAPLPLRYAAERRQAPGWEWLRPGARDRARSEWARQRASAPGPWAEHVRWQHRQRSQQVLRQTLWRLGQAAGAAVCSPLLDPDVVAAVAAAGGRLGFGDRRATVAALFDGLLPHELLQRPSKATFNQALLRHRTREFVAGLDGRCVDDTLVDVGTLRDLWSSDRPPWGSALLIQQAWLSAQQQQQQRAPGSGEDGA